MDCLNYHHVGPIVKYPVLETALACPALDSGSELAENLNAGVRDPLGTALACPAWNSGSELAEDLNAGARDPTQPGMWVQFLKNILLIEDQDSLPFIYRSRMGLCVSVLGWFWKLQRVYDKQGKIGSLFRKRRLKMDPLLLLEGGPNSKEQSEGDLLQVARANFFDRFQGVWKGNYEIKHLSDRDFSPSKGSKVSCIFISSFFLSLHFLYAYFYIYI